MTIGCQVHCLSTVQGNVLQVTEQDVSGMIALALSTQPAGAAAAYCHLREDGTRGALYRGTNLESLPRGGVIRSGDAVFLGERHPLMRKSDRGAFAIEECPF